jgi:transposase
MLRCLKCGLFIDRDENAAINIRKRGLEKFFSTRFEPIGLPSEAMNGNPTTTVILLAEGSQSNVPTLDRT